MPEVKTSFIPKKSFSSTRTIKGRRRSVGLVMVGAIFIFFASLAVAAGAYLYEIFLERQVQTAANNVEIAQRQIQSSLITEIKRFDARLTAADTLLGEHVVILPLFSLLEDRTLPTIRYDQLQLTFNSDDGIRISLSGEAAGYSSLALQSDIFGSQPEMRDPIFSNLSLSQTGNVSFNFSATLENSLFLYSNNLTGSVVGVNNFATSTP